MLPNWTRQTIYHVCQLSQTEKQTFPTLRSHLIFKKCTQTLLFIQIIDCLKKVRMLCFLRVVLKPETYKHHRMKQPEHGFMTVLYTETVQTAKATLW